MRNDDKQPRRRRFAVIGSGLAGLTAAYLMRQEGMEVWLIEKSDRLGFHASSVHVPTVKGEDWVVDVPMRSFQGGYYPLLIALYHHLGLPLIPVDFRFSFSTLLPDRQETYFIYSGASGLALPSLPARSYRSPRRLVRAIWRFATTAIYFVIWLVLCFLTWHGIVSRTRSLQATTRRIWVPGYGRFTRRIIVPIFSAVGTMTSKDVMSMPMGVLADYVYSTIGTRHYRLSTDSAAEEVARRLARPVREQGKGYVRLGQSVDGLDFGDGVRIRLGGETLHVDKVILATPASVAERLMPKRYELERAALGRVQYRETIVVTHRDMSVLPDRGDARDINLVLPDPSTFSRFPSKGTVPYFSPTRDCVYTAGTHLIRPPAHFGTERPVLQTTNPITPIDPTQILGMARLERALPFSDSNAFRRREDRLVYVVGSYAYPGIPLLEGCVGSAIRAVREVVGERGPNIHELQPGRIRGPLGGVDWTTGLGSTIGRAWRWRWRREGEVF